MSPFRFRLAAVTLVPLALGACSGNSNSTSPSPAPTASQARITVTASAPATSLSPLAAFNFRTTFNTTVAEAAGVGANINFIRLALTRSGVELERQEISSSAIVSQTGTNRLNASATRNLPLVFDFNNGSVTGGVLTFNFTDDRGNVLAVDFPFTF
jgi:hypothetical protein